VDVPVNNAGFADFGKFHKNPLEKGLNMVDSEMN